MKQKNLMHKHSVRREKHQPGCIWGLLRIFDFRQSHSVQRLLSDRGHEGGANAVVGSQYSRKSLNISTNDARHKDSDSSADNQVDGRVSDETRFSEGSNGQVPMKTLIANEMSIDIHRDHILSNSEWRRNQSREQQKKKSKTSKMVHNFHSDSGEVSKLKKSDVACLPRPMEPFTGIIDQATPVDGSYNQPSQVENKRTCDFCHGVKQKPNEAAEDFLYQKFYDAEFLSEDTGLQHSKEFMDALEILNSNKELFLKLLQDPNSLLAKHIQGLRNTEMEQMSEKKSNKSSDAADKDNVDREFSKQSPHRFSRIRYKLWGRGSSLRDGGACRNSTKIVVLKPGSPGIQDNMGVTGPSSLLQSQCHLKNQDEETLTSSFSLKEIKRKLKLAISDAKAEQRRISMDGVLHRIPYGCQGSEDLGRSLDERHLRGEPSDLPKTIEHLRSKIWKEKNWRPLRPQGVIVDEWSALSGFNYLANKNITYSRSLSQPRESAATRESRRHLFEILNARNADECLLSRPTARTLGRVLSLPDYISSSPRLNPWSDSSDETQTHSEHLCFEFPSHFSKKKISECMNSAKQDSELKKPVLSDADVSTCNQDNGSTTEIQDLNSDSGSLKGLLVENLTEEVVNSEGTGSQKGDERRMQISDADDEGTSKTMPSDPSEPDYGEEKLNNTPDLCTCFSPEKIDINMASSIQLQNSVVDMTIVSHPSLPLSFQLSDQPVLSQNSCEKLHEPSPVSVLEPAFSEDISSRQTCFPALQEIVMKPRKIHFEELEDSQVVESLSNSKSNHEENGTHPLTSESEIALKRCLEDKGIDFEYVRLLLEASKSTGSKESVANWDSSDQPLDSSLFLLVDPPDEVSVDQLLLFDCVNEVLLEISERFSGCQGGAPCCKPIVRPFPAGEHLLEEVWSGINWHLTLHTQDSRTLEQLVERDLAKSCKWMDLTSDAENIGVEFEVTLLEDLIEEAVIELVSWDVIPEFK